MEVLGHLERFAASMYPYRWLIGITVSLFLTGAIVLVHRRGWHHVMLRHKVMTALVLLPLLVVTVPVGYYLLSPLWTRTHLEEESPLALAAQQMPAESTAEVATPQMSTSTPVPAVVPSPTAVPSETPVATVPPAPDNTPIPEPAQPTSPPTTVPVEPPPTSTPEPIPTVPPEPTPEPAPTEFVPYVVLAGEFRGADDFHFGSGSALLIATAVDQAVLRLENFSVQNGPDLFVYLSTNPDGWSEDALNLGELRATDGSFNYDVPPGVDVSQYQSVVIWCRAFAVLFSTATLM